MRDSRFKFSRLIVPLSVAAVLTLFAGYDLKCSSHHLASSLTVTVTISGQVNANAPSFTGDEIAIYRDFLLHYPAELSNLIGMQDTTVPFMASTRFRDEPPPPNLKAPAYSGRKLPPEVMELTDEKAVTARIAAEGKLIDPNRRDPRERPDGYVPTHLTLSEVAFDQEHKEAAFIFSASCGCMGGQGGMVIYERKNGRWKLRTIMNAWQG
jgi:hypothetical protein